MQELWGSSHLSAGHAAYLENLYETYLTNPENLSKEWRDFFSNLPRGSSKNGDVSHQSVINEFKNLSRGAVLAKEEIDERQGKVIRLIQSYRNRGHQEGNIRSIGYDGKTSYRRP